MSDKVKLVRAEVFDHEQRKAISLAGPFGSAVQDLEDACLSDSEGLAVIMTLDSYLALTASSSVPHPGDEG